MRCDKTRSTPRATREGLSRRLHPSSFLCAMLPPRPACCSVRNLHEKKSYTCPPYLYGTVFRSTRRCASRALGEIRGYRVGDGNVRTEDDGELLKAELKKKGVQSVSLRFAQPSHRKEGV